MAGIGITITGAVCRMERNSTANVTTTDTLVVSIKVTTGIPNRPTWTRLDSTELNIYNWGGRYGYDYDPYYGGGGGYYLMGGGGYGGYGRGYGGYGGYGRGYGRGYYDDDYYGGGYYRGGYGRGRYGGYDDDYDDYYGGYGGYGGGYAGMAATATAITGKARLILWDSPLTTYDSGVNLSRYGTSMQDNIMYSGRNGRGRLYNNGLGRGGYYPSSFNYGYGGRYGGYYDDYW
eukprot:CAMPEP_0178841238 /NCGR_PEP_ID=MMETSP0746-20121128/14835_1 /TAXON_ID=913974 /ORGANISM="Nitzschia punctata, Strain CCMP561" /LENGTH=231 /DNA_ID=CAMNT_0020504429 /DNA_START=48 /DNA_END=744 /DNA_ORIENTATION=-